MNDSNALLIEFTSHTHLTTGCSSEEHIHGKNKSAVSELWKVVPRPRLRYPGGGEKDGVLLRPAVRAQGLARLVRTQQADDVYFNKTRRRNPPAPTSIMPRSVWRVPVGRRVQGEARLLRVPHHAPTSLYLCGQGVGTFGDSERHPEKAKVSFTLLKRSHYIKC